MNTRQLWNYMEDLRETSGNASKAVLTEMYQEHDPEEIHLAWRFIAKNPLQDYDDNMGVGKKTIRKAAVGAYNRQYDEIRDHEKRLGNLSDVFNVMDEKPGLVGTKERSLHTLEELQEDVQETARKSGNQMKSFIEECLATYEYPQVYSFAIVGDISLGVSSKTMLQVLTSLTIHSRDTWDRAYGIAPDIGYQAKRAKQGKEPRTEIRVGDRVKPQLASSRSLPDSENGWIGHTKYDGARLLIHVKTGSDPGTGTVQVYQDVQAFTRRRNDVTANLPELQEVEWPHTDFIVDAEAVGYDPETGEPLKYQKIMERFQREQNIEEKREEVEVRFKLFDLLYYGMDLTDKKFQSRWDLLQSEFPNEMLAETGQDIQEVYEKALEDGHEGVIAKDVTAPYHFQRDRSWRKVKPTKEPIELIVTGTVRGTGSMSDTLGAIKVETADGVNVGRVGTGFTDFERDKLWGIEQNGGLEGSIVEVKFEELQEKGDKYGLRFPRYERLRPEGEADTLERIKSL